MDSSIDEKLSKKLGLKTGETLDDRLKLLPTKEEFLNWMDKLMGELKAMREEQKATAQIISRHTDKVEQLQKIHPNNKHISTI